LINRVINELLNLITAAQRLSPCRSRTPFREDWVLLVMVKRSSTARKGGAKQKKKPAVRNADAGAGTSKPGTSAAKEPAGDRPVRVYADGERVWLLFTIQ